MSWNFRLQRDAHGYLSVVEAYYDKDGKLNGVTQNPATVGGDTVEEVLKQLKMMTRDVCRSYRDILDEKTLDAQFKKSKKTKKKS